MGTYVKRSWNSKEQAAMKTKEVFWTENHETQNTGIEDSKGNTVVDKRPVLRIWRRYIAELYDLTN